MQYLMLIYGDESDWAKKTPQEQEAVKKGYGQLRDELNNTGKFKGGSQLTPISAATTVRVRGGKRLTTDGPFAETKEQLGGYFLVDAKDLDEAISIAARMPSALDGSIEIRPLVVMEQAAKQA
jgi:hypothetical protein